MTDDNVGTVVDVCRRLDGVALPIELAAARVPLLGLRKLAASLDQRLRLLSCGSLTAPARQQTLRAALEWSHGLLGEAEQKVFQRLAVFVGSASLEAVQHVAADDGEIDRDLDEWAVLDGLGALVDRSLVAVVGGDHGDEPLRHRLLDTPQTYALEGRPRTAAQLIGYADAVYAATKNTRQVNEENAVRRALRVAADALGDAAVKDLRTDGATLRDDNIAALAFGDADR